MVCACTVPITMGLRPVRCNFNMLNIPQTLHRLGVWFSPYLHQFYSSFYFKDPISPTKRGESGPRSQLMSVNQCTGVYTALLCRLPRQFPLCLEGYITGINSTWIKISQIHFLCTGGSGVACYLNTPVL